MRFSVSWLVAILLVPGMLVFGPAESQAKPAKMQPDVSYRLRTDIGEGKLIYVGVGGDIEGKVNPTLHAEPGEVVQITLVNGDGAQHDIALPDFEAKSDMVTNKGASSVIVFRVDEAGRYSYFCTVPGHRAAGMEGLLQVGDKEEIVSDLPSIVRDPADIPEPVGDRPPQTVEVDLVAEELQARLADGTSYRFWTFNGTVPGPLVRVRQGDTVRVNLENAGDSTMAHSVDMHSVTGPGGGAVATQTAPGDETWFEFKALKPGLYVYHCATPMIANHISNGMYGMVLVEPPGGLPEVDQEFYVMQGELYTREDHGTNGELDFSVEKLLDEQPEYFTFNGTTDALTKRAPMEVEVGDTVRIYFGVGGPNATSSLHLIGEIFDRVWKEASFTSEPLTDVQTTTVAPGGATMVEFRTEVPGEYVLVDHALSRLERGLAGFVKVEGEKNEEIFDHADQ